MWSNNFIKTIGKWGAASFVFGIAISGFILGKNNIPNIPLRAYISDISTSSYQPTELQLKLDPLSNLNNITLPVNDIIKNTLDGLKLVPGINIGTGVSPSPIKMPSQNIDFSKFFSSSRVSPNDVIGFLKEAAITGINLSLLIITITTQVLKGVLSVIK